MENIIIILAVVLAVWYLYRRYKKTFGSENPSCGGSCNGCCSNQSIPNTDPSKKYTKQPKKFKEENDNDN
ncbi:MAG: FeoB-associated Cys-rich membrane protein [Desulfobacula sp.]|uniref:FeoB-associated Cys-rich membrane protein n=1 Tax=Desulfobacula sp. TaxID=2593537 RepID=UPI0025C5FB38|nr:FeoB-associated Cys-rich membrane protein [Desulfobacula sp.]MCD4718527.1 FeoB-associated Cys-rich membrane protein [Desulfobacula sp.]